MLVNNAGYGLAGAIEEVSEDEARAIIDTDLFGALWLTQAVLPGMRARGGGQIVQISSVGGGGAMPFFGLYNAAKWALEGFSEALAGEVRGSGIGVTIAELGAVDTHWATGSMRFATPLTAYDRLRGEVLGTDEVPWPVDSDATGGGATPASRRWGEQAALREGAPTASVTRAKMPTSCGVSPSSSTPGRHRG